MKKNFNKNKKKIVITILILFVLFLCIFIPIKTLSKNNKSNIVGTSDTLNVASISKQQVSEQNNKNTYKINSRYDLVPTDKMMDTKVVLFTFDDGPTKRSKDIIKILSENNIKTIFFINGIHDKENKGVIQSMFEAGHSIGNHTWSHQNLSKINYEKAVKEIDDNSKLIKAITGANPTFFRSPFGMSTKETREYVKSSGMLAMNWSGAAKDWESSTKNKDVFIKNVMQDLHGGAIILLHEHPHTVAFLPDLIEAIKSAGYTFITPSQIVQ